MQGIPGTINEKREALKRMTSKLEVLNIHQAFVLLKNACRRSENIALPSFHASMNSVGELLETILSRINITDTNELAEAVESWRRASGGAPLLDDPGRQKAWDLPIVERN